MSFAITVANLIETMKQPGCPVCALERKAARKAVDSFLWESMMEPKTRETAMDAFGFCQPHTRLLVAADLSHSGLPLATNILYEQLNGRTNRALQGVNAQPTSGATLRRLLRRVGIELPQRPAPVLTPTARCPICSSAEQSALNALNDLFEEVEKESADLMAAYNASDGLCLGHLRLGLTHLAGEHPRAAQRLVQISRERIDRQRALMQEFIRKKNWEYRDESLSDAESNAWRDALTFYTGLPGDSFTHKVDEPG